jgi:hypothetical protein
MPVKIDYADHAKKNKGVRQKPPLVPQSVANHGGSIAEILAAGIKHANKEKNRQKRKLSVSSSSARKRGRGGAPAGSQSGRHIMTSTQGSVSCSSVSSLDPLQASELFTASRKPLFFFRNSRLCLSLFFKARGNYVLKEPFSMKPTWVLPRVDLSPHIRVNSQGVVSANYICYRHCHSLARQRPVWQAYHQCRVPAHHQSLALPHLPSMLRACILRLSPNMVTLALVFRAPKTKTHCFKGIKMPQSAASVDSTSPVPETSQ